MTRWRHEHIQFLTTYEYLVCRNQHELFHEKWINLNREDAIKVPWNLTKWTCRKAIYEFWYKNQNPNWKSNSLSYKITAHINPAPSDKLISYSPTPSAAKDAINGLGNLLVKLIAPFGRTATLNDQSWSYQTHHFLPSR